MGLGRHAALRTPANRRTMLWLLVLVASSAGAGDPLIIDDLADLCGPDGVADNCDEADGTWNSPYHVRWSAIAELGDGCGTRAAIAVCVNAVVEIESARAVGTSPAPLIDLSSPTRLVDVAATNRGGPALSSTADLEVVWGKYEGIGQVVVRSDGALRMDGVEIKGPANTLLTSNGPTTISGSQFSEAYESGLVATRDVSIEESAFSNIGAWNPRPAEPPVNGPGARALSIASGHAIVRDSTFDVTDTGIQIHDGGTLDASGNTFTQSTNTFAERSNPFAVRRGHGDDPSCDVEIHHNQIIGLGIYNGHASCVMDASQNWWGSPDGPGRSFGDLVTIKPWLLSTPEELPVVSVEAIFAADGGFRIIGTASPNADTLRFTWGNGSMEAPAARSWQVEMPTLYPGLVVAGCHVSCGMAVPVPLSIHAAPGLAAASPGSILVPAVAIPAAATTALVATISYRRRRGATLPAAIQEALHAKESEVEAVREDLHEFLAGAAHDLRGPIVQLMIATQVAARRAARGEDVQGLLDSSAVSGKRLQRLVDDLMLFGRAGYDPSSTESIPLQRTIEDVASSVATAQASVVMSGPPGEWRGDHLGVARILQNLLSNAVRSTPEGRIHITWGLAPFFVQIQDDGPGIPPMVQARLFQPLVRGAQGSGLGLATAARLAERMGGRLTLMYTGVDGTCFRLTAP